jgi:hypothetical protein
MIWTKSLENVYINEFFVSVILLIFINKPDLRD